MPTERHEEMHEAIRQLLPELEAREWGGGVRIVVQGAMRAPVGPHGVTLEASWRADVFYDAKRRRPAFTLVAETPEQLLRDLAGVVESQRDGDRPAE